MMRFEVNTSMCIEDMAGWILLCTHGYVTLSFPSLRFEITLPCVHRGHGGLGGSLCAHTCTHGLFRVSGPGKNNTRADWSASTHERSHKLKNSQTSPSRTALSSPHDAQNKISPSRHLALPSQHEHGAP
eukprot:1159223-Pelagomonas_calceolata.AAC.4